MESQCTSSASSISGASAAAMLISLLSGVWPGTLAVTGRVMVVAGRVQAERAAVGRIGDGYVGGFNSGVNNLQLRNASFSTLVLF